MLAFHLGFAWFVIVANGLVGVWWLVANWVPAARSTLLWWATGVAQVGVVVQAAAGFWLLLAQGLEAPEFHVFYGVVAIVSVGIIVGYRQQVRHRVYLLYGLGSWFLMGLGLRAVVLA